MQSDKAITEQVRAERKNVGEQNPEKLKRVVLEESKAIGCHIITRSKSRNEQINLEPRNRKKLSHGVS